MKAVHRVFNPTEPPEIARHLCALAVMTKAPRAGRVKTRLVPPLTPDEAATLNACFLRDTATAISTAVESGKKSGKNARGVAVYTPVGWEDTYADILPPDFDLVPQRGASFGERLCFAAEDLFQCGFDGGCLIDSDSPTVPAATFAHAVEILHSSREHIVLGPSDDGGYYLIGLKKPHREMFEQIDWSTDRVFEQTVARAKEIGLEVKLLPMCYDVDDSTTLRRLCDELLGENSRADVAPETGKFLREIIDREGRERIWPNVAGAVSAAEPKAKALGTRASTTK
jgi:rSAM/selenodomain-associated transferase 1